MSTTVTLTEQFAAPLTASKVNREGGYIDGVLVCGVTSLWKRDYPVAVLRRDHVKYEGMVVNCDHAEGESTVDKRLGWFSDVKPGDDGRPRGRLHLLKSHPMTERVFEAAERNPALFGMSHRAVCKTKRINGRETVESIEKVLSVDLVAVPATTKSLYESHTGGAMDETQLLTEATAKLTAAQTELNTIREQLAAVTAERDTLLKESAGLKLDKFLADSGLTQVTESERKAVGLLTDEADRKALIESLKKGRVAANAQQPKSGEQNAVKVTEAGKTGSIPTDGKAFAESLKRAK